MRTETLLIGTRAELLERWKDKKCPGEMTIERQIGQYTNDYPFNFGVVFFLGKENGATSVCKEYFQIREDETSQNIHV